MRKPIIVGLLNIGSIRGGITAYSQLKSSETTVSCDK